MRIPPSLSHTPTLTHPQVTLQDHYGNRCYPKGSFCDACVFGMSMMVHTAQTLAANKGKRPALSEQPLFSEFDGAWGTHDVANGGGRYFELTYIRREGGAGISLQLWYSLGGDGERIALHEKPFVIGEGRDDAKRGKNEEEGADSQNKGFAKQIMPGDYVRAAQLAMPAPHSHTRVRLRHKHTGRSEEPTHRRTRARVRPRASSYRPHPHDRSEPRRPHTCVRAVSRTT